MTHVMAVIGCRVGAGVRGPEVIFLKRKLNIYEFPL